LIRTDEDDEFERIAMENRLKSSGLQCCTYDCIQGRDCPIRKQKKEINDKNICNDEAPRTRWFNPSRDA